MYVGWKNGQRIYGSVIHLDVIHGNVWLQHNGTEGDIAQELMALGVERNAIVLGFRSPAVRIHTGLSYLLRSNKRSKSRCSFNKVRCSSISNDPARWRTCWRMSAVMVIRLFAAE